MMRWKIGWLVTTLTTLTFISTVTLHDTAQNESNIHDGFSKSNVESDSNISDVNSTLINLLHVESDIREEVNIAVKLVENDEKDDDNDEDSNSQEDGNDSEDTTDINTPKNVIETAFGPVNGYAWPESNEIVSYLDIPYGKFNLFEAPSDPDEWNIVRNITTHDVRCPQLVTDQYIGINDCLTLNVFAPKNAKNAAVLFYIHESNWLYGSGDPSIYGPENIVPKGIILVLPNYRLGPLGFLCLNNKTAPGNAALKDLTLALNWTKNNIELFGGNPTNIVVSGDGTSAALAGYLALSSKSRNYISKVIIDSGSMLSHWAIDREPNNAALELADKIRSKIEKDKLNEDLFKDIDIETLIIASSDMTFKPCVEEGNSDYFMDKTPWTVVLKENINLTFIIGSASHAGLREAIQHDNDALAELNENFANALPNDLVFKEEKTKQNIVKKVKEQYFGADNITSSKMENLSLYNTDISYQGPGLRIAKALLKAGSMVFLYEFSFMGKLNKELQAIPSELRFGATRGDIVGYLFSKENNEIDNENPKENKVIKLLSDMWVSFIQTGRPTAENVYWKYLNETPDNDEVWLSIGEEVKSVTGFHSDRLDLWTDIYNEYFIDGNTAFGTKAVHLSYYMSLVCLIKFSNSYLF